MQQMKRVVSVIIFIFSFSAFANAQGAVNYGFLEVVNYEDKPVENAAVKVEASCDNGEFLTDQTGFLKKGFPIGFGDCHTDGFSVSKKGYYPFTDYFGVTERISSNQTLKLELLKIPGNEQDRKAIGDEQRKREFFVAAQKGDLAAIRKLLKSGFSPNLTTSNLRGVPGYKDVPIILFAVASGNFAAINEFISAGVDVRKVPNILIAYLDTDPYLRNHNGTEDIIKGRKIFEDGFETLVEKGADINARGQNKGAAGTDLTTLMIAADRGYPRTVKFLIDKGVSVNAKDDLARTALIHALMNPDLKTQTAVIELLLQAGADPNVVAEDANPRYDSYCESPLMYAVLHGDTEIVRLLIKSKADVNLGCKKGGNALKIAQQQKRAGYSKNADEIVKILEAAGAKE